MASSLQATLAARELAKALEDDWTATGDRSTVFFDPQDSPTSRVEEAVYDVAQKLDELTEEVKHLTEETKA